MKTMSHSPLDMYFNKDIPNWEKIILRKKTAFDRYGFAVLVSCLTLILLFVLVRFQDDTVMLSIAFLNVILSAMYGGRGPAIVDSVITSIGIDYFFARPLHETFDSPGSFFRIFIFMSGAILVSYLVIALRDDYELLIKKNAQIEREKVAKDNVLAYVSHDLKSPLSAIIMRAEMLLRSINSGKTPQNIPAGLNSIIDSSERMNHLIEDLLDAVKIEAGNFRINKKMNDISRIINDAIEGTHKSAEEKKIEITVQYNSHDDGLSCDKGRICQVFSNLLSNSIKFSPDHSKVAITVDSNNDEFIVNFQDQGKGIKIEDQQRIFEKFWQEKSGAHKGIGLGLYISKSIVNAHDGRIAVSSSPGEGARFSVYLPKGT